MVQKKLHLKNVMIITLLQMMDVMQPASLNMVFTGTQLQIQFTKFVATDKKHLQKIVMTVIRRLTMDARIFVQ